MKYQLRFLGVLSFFFISFQGIAQCATSGTISADCTTTGNLLMSGDLTVDPGVTVTVTGTLRVQAGRTLTGTGATFNLGTLAETFGTGNTILGGTYNVTDFSSGSGGTVIISGASILASGTFELVQATVTNSTISTGTNMFFGSGITTFDNSTVTIGTANADTGVDAIDFNGGADVRFNNGSTIDVTGDVDGGSGADLTIDASDMTISGNFDNVGNGSVTVQNNGTLYVGGDFDNSSGGNVSADSGGSLEVEGDYDNSGGGNSDVDGGSIAVGGTYSGNPPTGDGGDCDGGGGGCCGVGCSPLPVTLTRFESTQQGNRLMLSWETQTELNNKHFTLERSFDAINFSEVAKVQGAGTSSRPSNYMYADEANFNSTFVYYRLSQTDFDGTYEQLKVIAVEVSWLRPDIQIYPNPATSFGRITVAGAATGASWSLSSLTGQIVKKGTLESNQKLQLDGLETGTYLLTVSGERSSVVKRLWVQ